MDKTVMEIIKKINYLRKKLNRTFITREREDILDEIIFQKQILREKLGAEENKWERGALR